MNKSTTDTQTTNFPSGRLPVDHLVRITQGVLKGLEGPIVSDNGARLKLGLSSATGAYIVVDRNCVAPIH